MVGAPEIPDILREHLSKPDSSFSIGSYGAIAEFHRSADEPVSWPAMDDFTAVTARGAIRVILQDDIVPLAYETLSGRPGLWQHGVAFCLPEQAATSEWPSSLTEIGPDVGAIRDSERDHIMFDLGLGAQNVDFCIRTGDPSLTALLRRHLGLSVLAPHSQAMAAILQCSPHRVAISQLGRIEFYQEIGKIKTPEGPHTHVLPKLLRSGRTHSANIPVPRHNLPCLSLYPANPMLRSDGEPRPFSQADHDSFQRLIEHWGAPDYRREKRRAREAFMQGRPAATYEPYASRLGRLALRIALRQVSAEREDLAEACRPWLDRFEHNTGRAPQTDPAL